MAKLLIAVCVALFLFNAIVTKPLGAKDRKETMKEIITKLHDLKLPHDTPYVPKLFTEEEKNTLPTEVLACRAVESLKHLSNPEKEKNQFASLSRSLALLSHRVNCTVNSDEIDLHQFVKILLEKIQEHLYKF